MEKEEIMTDIKALEEIKSKLTDDVEKLRVMQSNLDASLHTKEVELEEKFKLRKMELEREILKEKEEVKKIKEKTEARIDLASRQEEGVRARIFELEKRELDVVDLTKKKNELTIERNNFQLYKFNIEKQLEVALEKIAEANELEEKIKMENEALLGREKSVAEKEKFWNDRIGELELFEKQITRERENLEALQTVKEVVNA